MASAGPKRPRRFRLALLLGLAPRKLGSFEDWIVALCREVCGRGDQVDIYSMPPVHPAVAEELKRIGAGWHRADALVASPIKAIPRLASYDLLHLDMYGAFDRACFLAYVALPARVVFVAHAPVPDTPRKRVHRLLLDIAVKRVIGCRLDGLAGVSNYTRDQQQQWLGIARTKVRTIYNGVDLSRFASSPPRGLPRSGTVVIAVVNLVPWKGIDVLLRAFAKVADPAIRLLIVGDGPEESSLKMLSAALNLQSRVSFLGLRDDVNLLLRGADILVHPALYAEPFGLVIAEAMASGLAVIASAVGGVPELIEHDQSGLLFAPGDEHALTAALNQLNEHPEDRLRLGTAARRRVAEHFSLDKCVKEHLNWCDEVLSGPSWRDRLASQF
jgi:glycosyltransferase involved in cell wall biosynthesis